MGEQPKTNIQQSLKSTDGQHRPAAGSGYASGLADIVSALTPGANADARKAFADKIRKRAEVLADGSKATVSVRVFRSDDGTLHAQIGSSVDGKATEALSTLQLTTTKG